MAGLLDSEAVFEERLIALGLVDVFEQFGAMGWTTLGNFAFAANFSPGSADEASVKEHIMIPLVGPHEGVHRLKAPIRRLATIYCRISCTKNCKSIPGIFISSVVTSPSINLLSLSARFGQR